MGRHEDCNGHSGSNGDVNIAKLAFDETDLLLLRIVRVFCIAYCEPQRPYWESAFELAKADFGDRDGPLIANGILTVLKEMRSSRSSTFRFNNPRCKLCSKKITIYERLLIETIMLLKQGNRTASRVSGMILNEGKLNKSFMDSVEDLVRLLGAVEQNPPRVAAGHS